MRIFLAAHRVSFAGIRIEQDGRLLNFTAIFQSVDLPLYFVVDGLLHEFERVEILDLATRAQFRTGMTHRHINVAAERAFLHVAVADTNPAHQRMQCFGVRYCFGSGAHIRLGNDLQQRRSGAIQVDAGHALMIFVQRLACIFLQMGAGDTHHFFIGLS